MRTAQKKSGDWLYRCRGIEQSAEILNKETSAEILNKDYGTASTNISNYCKILRKCIFPVVKYTCEPQIGHKNWARPFPCSASYLNNPVFCLDTQYN